MNAGQPNLPLSGITVVSLEQAIAAPLASRHLADWGARVIKIERPEKGDFCRDYDHVMNGMSSQFAWTNRSKQSLALDVKSSEGKRVLDALLPQADVFLQNLAPGAAQRLGLDAATLVGRFPRLIACDISGYGRGGPYSQKKAYDLLVQCETGFLAARGNFIVDTCDDDVMESSMRSMEDCCSWTRVARWMSSSATARSTCAGVALPVAWAARRTRAGRMRLPLLSRA